jgi:adenylate kinase family enzyme
MFTEPLTVSTFKVDVVTSDNGGHPPEFWARRAAERIVQVADSAPEPIRDQARAFQKQVEQVILYYMKQAIQCDRSSVTHQLLSDRS